MMIGDVISAFGVCFVAITTTFQGNKMSKQQIEIEAATAAKKFIQAGGTRDRWIAVFDRVKANGSGHGRVVSHGQAARPVRQPVNLYGPESLAVKNAIAKALFDRVFTSDGRPWGDVGAHELDGYARDGKMATALRNHLGVLTNEQRMKPIRELISPKKFEQIWSETNAAR